MFKIRKRSKKLAKCNSRTDNARKSIKNSIRLPSYFRFWKIEKIEIIGMEKSPLLFIIIKENDLLKKKKKEQMINRTAFESMK